MLIVWSTICQIEKEGTCILHKHAPLSRRSLVRYSRSAEPARFGYLNSIAVKQYEPELLPSLSNAYYLPTHSEAPW
jgi:hypothetical protein